MKILFFGSIFPQPGKPTRGIYCEHLCEALAAKHEVRVVSPWSWLDRLRWVRQGRPHPTPAAALPVEYPLYWYPPGVLRGAYAWFMARSAGRAVHRTLAEFAPDCVLSYWVHPDGAVAAGIAHSLGVPSLLIAGGSDVMLLTHQHGRRRRIVAALEAASAVVTVSHSLRSRVLELGIDPAKVHVVRQGIDHDLFHVGDQAAARRQLKIPEDGKMLVFVGNLLPVKGLEVLLAACAALRDRGVAFRLYLVGDGPLRKTLEEDCRARSLGELVTFLGARPQHQLPDWYRAADLTVLTSWSEGLPNVLRESLACGTPFVSTNVGGVAEIADYGAHNCLVPAGDAAAFADAVATSLAGQKPPPVPYKPPTWADAADAYVRILAPLLSTTQQPDPKPKRRAVLVD
jgi:glycosyltransferase involved in cell wall biosynthesis